MLEKEKAKQTPAATETNHPQRVTPELPDSSNSGPNRSLHQMASSLDHHGPSSGACRAGPGGTRAAQLPLPK